MIEGRKMAASTGGSSTSALNSPTSGDQPITPSPSTPTATTQDTWLISSELLAVETTLLKINNIVNPDPDKEDKKNKAAAFNKAKAALALLKDQNKRPLNEVKLDEATMLLPIMDFAAIARFSKKSQDPKKPITKDLAFLDTFVLGAVTKLAAKKQAQLDDQLHELNKKLKAKKGANTLTGEQHAIATAAAEAARKRKQEKDLEEKSGQGVNPPSPSSAYDALANQIQSLQDLEDNLTKDTLAKAREINLQIDDKSVEDKYDDSHLKGLQSVIKTLFDAVVAEAKEIVRLNAFFSVPKPIPQPKSTWNAADIFAIALGVLTLSTPYMPAAIFQLLLLTPATASLVLTVLLVTTLVSNLAYKSRQNQQAPKTLDSSLSIIGGSTAAMAFGNFQPGKALVSVPNLNVETPLKEKEIQERLRLLPPPHVTIQPTESTKRSDSYDYGYY